MNEFGRFMKELNSNMDDMVQMLNRVQGVYKSVEQLSPIWKELSAMFQAREQQRLVNLSHHTRRRGSIRKRRKLIRKKM